MVPSASASAEKTKARTVRPATRWVFNARFPNLSLKGAPTGLEAGGLCPAARDRGVMLTKFRQLAARRPEADLEIGVKPTSVQFFGFWIAPPPELGRGRVHVQGMPERSFAIALHPYALRLHEPGAFAHPSPDGVDPRE